MPPAALQHRVGVDPPPGLAVGAHREVGLLGDAVVPGVEHVVATADGDDAGVLHGLGVGPAVLRHQHVAGGPGVEPGRLPCVIELPDGPVVLAVLDGEVELQVARPRVGDERGPLDADDAEVGGGDAGALRELVAAEALVYRDGVAAAVGVAPPDREVGRAGVTVNAGRTHPVTLAAPGRLEHGLRAVEIYPGQAGVPRHVDSPSGNSTAPEPWLPGSRVEGEVVSASRAAASSDRRVEAVRRRAGSRAVIVLPEAGRSLKRASPARTLEVTPRNVVNVQTFLPVCRQAPV
jgi:hypothetical protein